MSVSQQHAMSVLNKLMDVLDADKQLDERDRIKILISALGGHGLHKCLQPGELDDYLSAIGLTTRKEWLNGTP